jgi:hypothetical protein
MGLLMQHSNTHKQQLRVLGLQVIIHRTQASRIALRLQSASYLCAAVMGLALLASLHLRSARVKLQQLITLLLLLLPSWQVIATVHCKDLAEILKPGTHYDRCAFTTIALRPTAKP